MVHGEGGMSETMFTCDYCDRPAPLEEQHLGILGLYWLWDGTPVCLPCIVLLVGEADREYLTEQLRRLSGRDAA